LDLADNKAIPAADASADMTVAGWVFGHQTEWNAERWQDEIGAAVDEMLRLLRPGGAAVIIETMGTGARTPAPPNPMLAAYYAWLEQSRGFSYKWIRTDYHFESIDEGVELFRFFFGDALAERVAHEGNVVVSECTGVWWRTKDETDG
jgi:ubiquinone/menaquinone biosynthesis C-methylase UbiE